MRMFDLLAKVLARVIFLKNTLDFPKAADELATACRNLLGLDRDVMKVMDDDSLVALLGADESMAGPKCYVLGMLLREESGLSASQGDIEAAVTFSQKSLRLLLEAFVRGGEILPNHRATIDEALSDLGDTPLSSATLKLLIRMFELEGRFDKAEDLLFDLIEREPGVLPEGLEFYRRLLQKDDATLDRGNLPRAEIEEAIQELHDRASR